MQIVIAWTEETQEIVKIGRVDLGESHKFKPITIAKSCMWMNKGTDADLSKARAYAAREGRLVFVYDSEKDPLGRARRDALKTAEVAR